MNDQTLNRLIGEIGEGFTCHSSSCIDNNDCYVFSGVLNDVTSFTRHGQTLYSTLTVTPGRLDDDGSLIQCNKSEYTSLNNITCLEMVDNNRGNSQSISYKVAGNNIWG